MSTRDPHSTQDTPKREDGSLAEQSSTGGDHATPPSEHSPPAQLPSTVSVDTPSNKSGLGSFVVPVVVPEVLEEGSSSEEEEEKEIVPASPKKQAKLLHPAQQCQEELDTEATAEVQLSFTTHACNLSRLRLIRLDHQLPTDLVELDLSENALQSIPEAAVSELRLLQKLNLSNNQLEDVPICIFDIPTLETLLLDHNHVHHVATEHPSNEGKAHLPALVRLGLDWNDLHEFPLKLLLAAPSLAELFLSENAELAGLPDVEILADRKITIKVDNRPRLAAQVEAMQLATRAKNVTIEWNKIYPDRVKDPEHLEEFLFLGSVRTAQCLEVYRDLNIGFVLTAGRHLQVAMAPDMEQLELALDDLPGEDLIPFFEKAFEFIEKARLSRRGILIHCFAGMSRSVAITIAYLMWAKGLSRDAALALVRETRPAANPNEGFMKGLLRYEKYLEQHRTRNGRQMK